MPYSQHYNQPHTAVGICCFPSKQTAISKVIFTGGARGFTSIATTALSALLNVDITRLIYGRAAKDNSRSIRVLEKCGFVLVGEEKGFANAREAEIAEVVLKLA